MISHDYLNASDNPAQWMADRCDRQEVTADFYLEHMVDEPLFRWVDGHAEFNLDPWRLIDMVPDRPARLFVQRKDMRRLGINPGEPGGRRIGARNVGV